VYQEQHPATLFMEALAIFAVILSVGFLCGVGATLFALYWLGDKLPDSEEE
jgi:hypothetical protein